ncbi:FAD-binding and (Fe-S)-binding domain-containing protein [Luteipulveratus sp. YIM 133132]|uniref:FAD-binding and (Fe-S)-binding domain-containing protein n=1 Tax=Luteipulveratus flavus TaxID=3031728 RepID=UPI0023B15A31|nr:FAD-binding and (Fe-S)-binding domain-containing protein [Luteipulveratus sp. YIM 133132]MDE9365790.1 FAD-binding and (Fe-S)-binding domain-containing protein [Luteipulveratus sp. YIM 133132]
MTAELVADLRAAGLRDVLADSTSRAAYSSDASLYRLLPQVVVRPYDRDELLATLEVARRHGAPVTSRGGGTSIAGNAVGTGIVVDFSRHMNRVLTLDTESESAVVQPGTVHATLQRQALAAGLRYGPDPSSHSRCTVGGMIGNNACGNRALGYGKTGDNLLGAELVTAAGEVLRTAVGTSRADVLAASPTWAGLDAIAGRHLSTIRTELGRFGRQVSGYAAQHLLPEAGFDVTRLLAGSEGTLGVLSEATVRLVTEPAERLLVVLGYPDIAAAGDASPTMLGFDPVAVEGMDKRIVDILLARRGPAAVPVLPRGAAWLLVELAGDDPGEVRSRADRLAVASGAIEARIVADKAEAATIWRVREDGAGLSGRSPRDRPAHAGWEDAAVPPERLGAYLRDFDALLEQHDLTGLPYGHFGDGCLHIRIDFPLESPSGTAQFGAFLRQSAALVASYGGSLSGEHGDGRARSELLPTMYSPEALQLFAEIKHHLDPDNLLNPGVLVDPAPATADLRIPQALPVRETLAFSLIHDHGDFSQAVHRCTGVGKCRADNTGTGGVMCPSYLATGEEKDSTRGRARVLQEMVNGSLVQGWNAPEVHEALDLCLSCKGCASDCPTGIDMATYKSEVLHQTYKRRPRPRAHYALGQLPRWVRMGSRMPTVVNAMFGVGERFSALKKVAGVDPRRSVPPLAPRTFRAWAAANGLRTFDAAAVTDRQVVLMADTFTDHFSPQVGEAAVRVLRAAGYEPVLDPPGCCGLTWITTGQLDAARRILGDTVGGLYDAAAAGVPIVGLEPSCTAVLRSDAVELFDAAGGEPAQRARTVAAAVRTLAELLTADAAWSPPDLAGLRVIAQPHCHHHAVMSWTPDAQLLRRAGADVRRLGGCCGLAGNFGVELGHYEVSVKVAEQALLPALRDEPDALLLADGFSCRTQVADLTERHGVHLAELLDPERT